MNYIFDGTGVGRVARWESVGVDTGGGYKKLYGSKAQAEASGGDTTVQKTKI